MQKLHRFYLLTAIGILGLLGGITTVFAQQQAKVIITKADDLPRRSVTFQGKARQILDDKAQLDQLVVDLVRNLQDDLNKFDIQDRATQKAYLEALLACLIYQEKYEEVLAMLPQIQALADKKAEQLTTGSFIKNYVAAYRKVGNNNSEAFKAAFREEYTQFWSNLPFTEVKEVVESSKGSLSLFNLELVTASLDSQVQPYLDNNNNTVPESLILTFVGIRLTLERRAALVPIMLEVLTALYEKNKSNVVKQDIWTERNIHLTNSDAGKSLVVAVWDSGVDISVFPAEALYQDKKGNHGVGYSLIDFKKDGLLLENPEGKVKSDLTRLLQLTKGYLDVQSAVESEEAGMLRKTIAGLKQEDVKDFQEELAFYGNYTHGTHVAGITVEGNPFAKLLVARMGFDYRTLPPAHTLADTKFQAKMYTDVVKYFMQNNVRVVNMSWRYNAAAYEGLLSLNGIGKDDEERKQMAREMFEIEKVALYEAIRSAPEILFVCGAGNENNDAGFEEYIPASFNDLPNLITIGAVDNEGKKTSFTTEGKNIKLYANGYEVESFVPGGTRIKFSGTSMASPHVANLAAKIIALRPFITPQEVVTLIEQTADNLPENPALKLINPRKAIQQIKQTPNTDPTALLIKKWKPDAATVQLMVDEYINQVRAQSLEQAKALEAQKQMLLQAFGETIIEYKPDGSLMVNVPGAPEQKGSWEVKQDKKPKLTTSLGSSQDYEWIESINTSTLQTTTSKGQKYTYVAQ